MTTSPAVARTRARVAGALVAFLILSPFLVWPPAAAGLIPRGAIMVCGFAGGIIGVFLLQELCREWRLIRCTMSAVTARTLTGERTVDLQRLTSVRLHIGFSYGGAHYTVVVRDAEGVRLGLTTDRTLGALRRAVRRIPVGSDTAPRVSPAARAFLDGGRSGRVTTHTVIGFLLVAVAITLYVAAVLRLAVG
ncbi:hypothetical protein [Streptomyces sp. NBC_01506]|uniref:hypothetical protein n=1 Tax=Streptomyces sp. NBC_01506 TaxID=2903887 RepID=UPI003870AF45